MLSETAFWCGQAQADFHLKKPPGLLVRIMLLWFYTSTTDLKKLLCLEGQSPRDGGGVQSLSHV